MFTGILPVAKTEDGLASVLGHGMLPKSQISLFSTNSPTPWPEIAHTGIVLPIR